MQTLLRLRPVQALVYLLIDTNVFRHTLEDHLKRRYIVRGASSTEDL